MNKDVYRFHFRNVARQNTNFQHVLGTQVLKIDDIISIDFSLGSGLYFHTVVVPVFLKTCSNI